MPFPIDQEGIWALGVLVLAVLAAAAVAIVKLARGSRQVPPV